MSQQEWLMNLAEGAGAWKPRGYTAFVRLEKKGLAEYVAGSPPRWRVTDAGWDQVKDLMKTTSRAA
jgi:hypothetical protein